MLRQTLALLSGAILLSGSVFAQDKPPVAGSYSIASVYDQTADGVKHQTWGDGVLGSLILTPNGKFSVFLISAGRDKAASKSPRTPVGPVVAYYGDYTMDGSKTMTYHVTGSSFPGWDGIERKVAIDSATDTELKLVTTVKGDAALGDFSSYQVWKKDR
jgi:hypothetical protein